MRKTYLPMFEIHPISHTGIWMPNSHRETLNWNAGFLLFPIVDEAGELIRYHWAQCAMEDQFKGMAVTPRPGMFDS